MRYKYVILFTSLYFHWEQVKVTAFALDNKKLKSENKNKG
jgi:hypothetical protein